MLKFELTLNSVKRTNVSKRKKHVFTKIRSDKGKKKFPGRVFNCDYCEYTSVRRKSLVLHTRKHTGDKPFKCESCDYKCSSSSAMCSHRRRHHTKEKNHLCPECGKSFHDAKTLNDHAVVHTKEKAFKCEVCDQAFGNMNNMRRHMRNHIPVERKFNCDQCGSKFANNGHLKRHVRNHFGEKSYQCTQCEKSFSENYNLKQHILTHDKTISFPCDAGCDKLFTSRSGYKAHLQTKHNTEDHEEYQCDECDKKASSVQALKRHVLTCHILEKTFKCGECKWAFKTNSKLTRHMKSHDK